MNFENGQHIKCILKSGIVVEGILEKWGTYVCLKTLDNARQIIIHNVDEVVMTTIFLKSATDLEEKFQEVYEQSSEDPERLKTLAGLRRQMAEQDKQIIANKVRNHHIGETKKVKYGYPGFFAKPSPK